MLQHIAIIMDGNGRWAEAQCKPRTEGHKQGAIAAKEIVRTCAKKNIQHLTLYTFSSENWNRPEEEVTDLMSLLRFYLTNEFTEILENNIRFNVVGNKEQLDSDILELINICENDTKNNTGLNLHLALSYGSRQEIVHAAQNIARIVTNGEKEISDITGEDFSKSLYTAGIPDPDLLIRTGGEQRLSNFLLWQSAYTELYFTNVLWPDFSARLLQDAITEFHRRERRYGTTTPVKKAAS